MFVFPFLALVASSQAYITMISFQNSKVNLNANATILFNTSDCKSLYSPVAVNLTPLLDIQNWYETHESLIISYSP